MVDRYPVWKRTNRSERCDDVFVVRRHKTELRLRGDTGRLVERLASALDGSRSLSALAGEAQVPKTELGRVLSCLVKYGIVAFTDVPGSVNTASMTGEEFHRLHREYCAEWLQPVYAHPFWEKVVTGVASRAQLVGFAFEKYHYIEAAHEHMAIAVANSSPQLMPHLARHFIEEYQHGDIYRAGLRSVASDDAILRSTPLPSTRALVNFLNESAARNSFSYYAGNELLQATENDDDERDAQSVNEFYAAIRRNYPWAARLVKSFEDHTRLDQQLGHKDVFLEMCRAMPVLAPQQVDDALRTTKLMAEHLLLFMEGIDSFYEFQPEVPRVARGLATI